MARRDGTIPDEKARATRRKILVEATKLFARRGYHRTTVADTTRMSAVRNSVDPTRR